MSLIAAEGNPEWKTRKVSILGAVKSFISQLTYGQELTRVSLPSEFLYPYGVLELIGYHFIQAQPALAP